MATRVRQKTAVTGTATAAVTETQSIEFVKTILHSSLSNLAWMRNLFPEKYFDDQGYGFSAGGHSYTQFAAGDLAEPEDGTVMQLLRRNRSKRVNDLLDWLEKGAFTALEAHNLDFIRIIVHADEDHPENAIETYTFNVRYSSLEGSCSQSIASVDISGPADRTFSIDKANKNVRRLYNKVKLLCNSLPQLPDERYISMQYELLNDAAVQDLPPGFVNDPYPTINLGTTEGWQRQTKTVDEAPTGSHETTFCVSYLEKESNQLNEFNKAKAFNEPKATLPPIPQQLCYSSTADSIANAGDDAYDTLHGNDASQRQTSTPSTVVESPGKSSANGRLGGLDSQASTMQDTENYTEDPRYDTAGYLRQAGYGASQQDDSLMSSQASNVPAMKAALRNMRRPERMIRGDTQSQLNPRTYSETDQALDQSDIPLPGEEDELPAATSSEFVLSRSTIAALDANKSILRRGAAELAKSRGKERASDLVVCQCRCEEEDDDTMVKCGYCNTNQHLHCYGYRDETDLPVTHVCYQCLLGTNDDDILQILRKLALRRRSMHVATQNGVQTQAQFAADLGQPVPEAKPLLQDLKDKGYVIRNGGANKKGKVHFIATESGPNYESMLEDLFDPLRYIRHHYVRSSNRRRKANPALQQFSDSHAMPPPKTPASRMRHIATMPASGSGRRSSVLPFRTPNRSNTFSTQPTKRPLDEELEDIVYPKRHAGAENGQLWKSARSQRPVKANGLSSPAG